MNSIHCSRILFINAISLTFNLIWGIVVENRKAFGLALKQIRTTKGMSQESFANVSSRTYVSTLERGEYSPTVEKVEQLADHMGVHSLTLLFQTFLNRNPDIDFEKLNARVRDELCQMNLISDIKY
jgi:transcriptional regulator with XRE-family HTH domain